MWACPHCRLALQTGKDGKSLVCPNRHAFDRAREGYVNLLPANRKRSREPGDAPSMLAARRRVHRANAYLPLAEALLAQLAELETGGVILDVGCGEGYYCGAMTSAMPASRVYGIDISRAAVRLAAKDQRAASFAVASSFQLPIVDASLDVVVRIFAPSDDAEVLRVLRPGQYYLEVTPASGHLGQLRERLYATTREHTPARKQVAGMCLRQQRRLDYRLAPSRELLADIVSMTPFAHRGHREKREALLKSGLDSVDMAFTLSLFQLTR